MVITSFCFSRKRLFYQNQNGNPISISEDIVAKVKSVIPEQIPVLQKSLATYVPPVVAIVPGRRSMDLASSERETFCSSLRPPLITRCFFRSWRRAQFECQMQSRAGNALAFWGSDVLAEVMQEPKWRDGIRAGRERQACRWERNAVMAG